MTYELAKQLKNAGFPQKFQEPELAYFNDGVIGPATVYNAAMNDITKIPTLEELIEACGEDFEALTLRKIAKMMGSAGYLWIANGSGKWVTAESPQEAVANLWFSLNGKTN